MMPYVNIFCRNSAKGKIHVDCALVGEAISRRKGSLWPRRESGHQSDVKSHMPCLAQKEPILFSLEQES